MGIRKNLMVTNTCVALFALLVFAFSISAFAIVGGEPIQATELAARSIVNVKMQGGMCTGTLVSPNVVLTSAHCRDRSGKPEWVALIGPGTTEPCDISPVLDSAFFPQSTRELPFRVHAPDILLLKIASPLCHAQAAEIQATALLPGDLLFGAGHGQGNKIFGQAEKFTLRIIDTKDAPATVSPMSDIAKELLSVGMRTYLFALPITGGSSFCLGDSGGPVYREENGKMQVLGVNGAILPNDTLGAAKCDQAYLQLLTPVAPYSAWIEATIQEWK